SCLSQSLWIGVAALASAVALSGCMSSPTYGTGKTAGRQLAEDVTSILSLGPRDQEQIEYKPRPKLATPANTAELPPPQENMVMAGTGQWPESPEERRARIRAEATETRDETGFRPAVRGTGNEAQLRDPMQRDVALQRTSSTNPNAARADFNR